MKNFKVIDKDTNKEYWISRSIAVASFIFYHEPNTNNIYVLANKRGDGTPDFQHCWNCPCGYLDFDETLKDAAIREIFEETGYIINSENLTINSINDDPKDSNKQNVTIRFVAHLTKMPDYKERLGGEQNEVDDIKWILINDIDNYDWAFNHNKLIKLMA